MESILIVDDDVALGTALSEELAETGYTVHSVSSADAAFEFLGKHEVDLMLLDLKMPEKDGFYVLYELFKKPTHCKVIVLTAYADVKSAIEAAKIGANDFISKPYDFDELLITIRKVLNSDSSDENQS